MATTGAHSDPCPLHVPLLPNPPLPNPPLPNPPLPNPTLPGLSV
jgi:hypothetical protein